MYENVGGLESRIYGVGQKRGLQTHDHDFDTTVDMHQNTVAFYIHCVIKTTTTTRRLHRPFNSIKCNERVCEHTLLVYLWIYRNVVDLLQSNFQQFLYYLYDL